MKFKKKLVSIDSLQTGIFEFKRFGHSYHLKIETVEDLNKILDLDEAHWVATTAPIETINADSEFLDWLDADDDKRIRVFEVEEAIKWLLNILSDRTGIKPGNTSLELNAINLETEDGKRIYTTAKNILSKGSSDQEDYITLEKVREIKKQVEEGGLDEAGVVLPEAAPNTQVEDFLTDIIATIGGAPHPSGKEGVTLQILDRFIQETRQYLDWQHHGELSDGQKSSAVMPLGRATPEAFSRYINLKDKIDQYFTLCDAIRLDPGIAERLRANEAQLSELDFTQISQVEDFLIKAPLAWPNDSGVLDFQGVVNPYYAERLKELQQEVFFPILGKNLQKIGRVQWNTVKEKFAEHQNWVDRQPESDVKLLDHAKLYRYNEDYSLADTVRRLIEESHKVAFTLDNINMLDKLILYQSYILPFVNSFVSFPDLYDPHSRALFEMGTLIVDGRHFTLAGKVLDRAQHASFSNASNMFVLYVEVIEESGNKLYEIAAPVTSGRRGNLQVNKWGIFHGIDGNEYHARVVQIVENPISFTEAFVAPFKRLGQAIKSKFEEAKKKAEQELTQQSLETVTKLRETPPAVEEQASATSRETFGAGGILAGGTIALAALGSSIAFIIKTLAGLSWQTIVVGLLAVITALMLPLMILAYLKLIRRDLSCILEGSGWGINPRMRLTRVQTHTFTFRPAYPPGSKGIRRRRWWIWLLLIIILAALIFQYLVI